MFNTYVFLGRVVRVEARAEWPGVDRTEAEVTIAYPHAPHHPVGRVVLEFHNPDAAPRLNAQLTVTLQEIAP